MILAVVVLFLLTIGPVIAECPKSRSVAARTAVRDRLAERRIGGGVINAIRVVWWAIHPFGGLFPRPGPTR